MGIQGAILLWRSVVRILDTLLPIWHNGVMEDKETYAHMRTYRRTQQNLRLAAALARKSGIDLLDELVKRELECLEKERHTHEKGI